MQEKPDGQRRHSPNPKLTQPPAGAHGGAWTDAEISQLKRLLHIRVTDALLKPLFPDRTAEAVRKRLSDLRRAHGVQMNRAGQHTKPTSGPATLDPDDPGIEDAQTGEMWKRRAVESNRRFLAALERARAA